MTFGEAIEAMKSGKKVARKGWNGKGMFLWLKPAAEVKKEWCKDPFLAELAEKNGAMTFQLPFSLSTLADYIATDRSAMMRELKRLREEDVIASDGRQFTLKNSI